MGVLPKTLAGELRSRLHLTRAIETGTYRGLGTRLLAEVFPEVVTIEVVPELATAAAKSLSRLPHVSVRTGSSRALLPELADASAPTLYWLDGHWSGGVTGGEEDQCPVLAEIAAIAGGNADDCILIDDARLFLAPPPPPHDVTQWPTFRQIEDAILTSHPGHRVIIGHDIVVAVPAAAADLAASFANQPNTDGSYRVRRALNRFLVR